MIEGRMDLNYFFEYGYAVTQIRRELADYLLKLVENQPFVEGDGFYASENFGAPLISEWEAPFIVPSENKNAPDAMNAFWKEAANSPYFSWFRETFGDFSQGCPMVNNFRQGDGMVWHTDSLDGTFMTNCLYLTRDVFEQQDGGYLSVGREVKGELWSWHRILANHGTLVSINNLSALGRHRVEKLVADKQRLTLLFHFGYAENTLTKNRLKDLRGIDA